MNIWTESSFRSIHFSEILFSFFCGVGESQTDHNVAEISFLYGLNLWEREGVEPFTLISRSHLHLVPHLLLSCNHPSIKAALTLALFSSLFLHECPTLLDGLTGFDPGLFLKGCWLQRELDGWKGHKRIVWDDQDQIWENVYAKSCVGGRNLELLHVRCMRTGAPLMNWDLWRDPRSFCK